MGKLPKIFVLDTNVVLHDSRSIYHFQENDLVIPITVLEELDKFKKTNDTLGRNARAFVRSLDEISDPRLYNGAGFPLGKGRGTLTISLTHPFPKELKDCFTEDIPDHRILSTSIWYKNNYPNRVVALVTKDINLRLKAKAVGMFVQDYLTDRIEENKVEKQQNNVEFMKDIDPRFLDELATNPQGVSVNEMKLPLPLSNQLFRFKLPDNYSIPVLENEDFSASVSDPIRKKYLLGRYCRATKSIVRVKPLTVYGISPRNDEQAFAIDVLMNPNIKLITLTGTAGTGKTLLALAAALAQSDNYDQILLARPVIPLKNQEIGFLPGDAKDKIEPYMLPLYDNLSVIKKNFRDTSKENVKIEDMLRREKLLISPLAYIRGRSLSNVFFIIDEAQNLTPHEVKTIITRAGQGTKIVLTGDIDQIDQPYLDKWSNGLTHLNDKLTGEELFAHVHLLHGERSELSELAGKKL